MDAAIQQALDSDRAIDITTIGRTSGQPHWIEIWFHTIDGKLYITGLPGRRDWYANMGANPGLHPSPQGERVVRPGSACAADRRPSREARDVAAHPRQY